MLKVTVEKKGKKKYFIARSNNLIIGRRAVAKSGLSKQSATEIFRKNKTFFKDRKKQTLVLKNFTQNEIIIPSKKTTFSSKKALNKISPKGSAKYDSSGQLQKGKRVIQYMIRATATKRVNRRLFKKEIVVTSPAIGQPLARTRPQAIDYARQKFYARLSEFFNYGYDDKKGVDVFEKSNIKIQEGWVYYTRTRRRT